MSDRKLLLLLVQPLLIVSAHHQECHSGFQDSTAAVDDVTQFHRDEGHGIAAEVLLVAHRSECL